MNKIRKGDTVKILSGEDAGKTGTVHDVFPQKEIVIVSGINLIKKAQRRTMNVRTQAGIIEREGPIHISNVARVCAWGIRRKSRRRRWANLVMPGRGRCRRSTRLALTSGLGRRSRTPRRWMAR